MSSVVSLTEQRRRLHGEFGMMASSVHDGQLSATVKDSSWERFNEFVEQQLDVEVVEHDYLGSGQTRVMME